MERRRTTTETMKKKNKKRRKRRESVCLTTFSLVLPSNSKTRAGMDVYGKSSCSFHWHPTEQIMVFFTKVMKTSALVKHMRETPKKRKKT